MENIEARAATIQGDNAMQAMAPGKLAPGEDGGLPPWKKGQTIDLRIVHWCLWGPRRSGMYETVRELIAAENKIEGVLAGMCAIPPQGASKRETARYVQGGMTDVVHPEMRTQDWGWGYKFGDIHLIHYSFDKRLGKLKPKVFMCHGTPEAVLESGLKTEDKANSLLSGAEWINKFEASIVTSQRAKQFWGVFDSTGDKMHVVNKGIDLAWWKKTATTQDLTGEPSVLYGEVWRGIKHPALLFFAMDELYKRNAQARLNAWSLTTNQALWKGFIGQADFWKFMGQDNIPGVVDYPEHYYSRGDVLVSPVTAGDLSRVAQEAMACGCPVISWDTDPHGENYPYKSAKGFDTMDMADKIQEAYGEVLDDREGVAAKCRKIAEQYFDIDEEARSIVQILRKVVSEQ
jgi:hypothetical protein